MAKNKKGGSQKKRENASHETKKVAENGTRNKENFLQNKSSNKNKQNASTSSHKNPVSKVNKCEKKSYLKLWLVIVLAACAVAAVGVVFRNEVQDLTEKLFEKYIHPEVLVTRQVDSPPTGSQDPPQDIPHFSDKDEAQVPPAATGTGDSREPDIREPLRTMDDNSQQKYADKNEGRESLYNRDTDEKVQKQSEKALKPAPSPTENLKHKPMVEETSGKSKASVNPQTSAKATSSEKTTVEEKLAVKQSAKTAEKLKETPSEATVDSEKSPPVEQSTASKTEDKNKETQNAEQHVPSNTPENTKEATEEEQQTANKVTEEVKKTPKIDVTPNEVKEPSQTEEVKFRTGEKDVETVKKTKSVETNQEVKQKNDLQAKKDQENERNNYKNSDITSDGDFKFHSQLDEADKLLEKEQLEKALEIYDIVLRKAVVSPRAHYGKGLTLDKLGFKYMSNEYLEQAIEFLARVLLLPDVPDELMKMAGRKLADRQQFRGWGVQSVKTFKTLVAKFPDDVKLKNELGVSYMMIGQNDRARDVFKEVLAGNPEDGFAKVHLGFIVKTQDNDLERAVKLLRDGIQSRAPGVDDGRFYLHLGDSLLRLGQESEARKFYKEGEEKGLFLSAWQRSLYNVNGLTGRPWWTMEQTKNEKYLKMLRDNWQTIRDEGLSQLNAKTGSFVPEDENLRDTGDWKQFTLFQQGRRKDENCAKVPKTCALIDKFPDAKGCKRGQVKFSVMSPGIHVWPHVGPTNCRIRAHLGLVVPEGPVIRVMNETRTWKEGQFIIFDDSFEHEVWHEGSELRLVLIVDFWHPELSESQRRRLSAI